MCTSPCKIETEETVVATVPWMRALDACPARHQTSSNEPRKRVSTWTNSAADAPIGDYDRVLQERFLVAWSAYVSSPARMKYCSMAVLEGERG